METVAGVPVFPVTPRGILKFKIASLLVPELFTVADDPADPVVTVPTETVAALPGVP
jgi:hypothetical protein